MTWSTLTKQIDDWNQEIVALKKAEENQEEENKELVEKRGNKESQSQTQLSWKCKRELEDEVAMSLSHG